jgi:hypothetical protein
MSHERGASLTELLISLFLSCLLMSALMQHYLSSKRQYHYFQTTLEQRFDEQLISELIQRSTRSAGFTPCRGINQLTTSDRRNESVTLAAIDTNAGKNHALKLSRMSDDFFTVAEVLSSTRLLIEGNAAVESNHPLLIADCFHAEVQVINRLQKTPQGLVITLKRPMAFEYEGSIYVGEWVEEQFLIKRNQQGLPALFYERTHQEELTSRFNQLSAEIIQEKGNVLLRVNLQVPQDKPLILETKIRTP